MHHYFIPLFLITNTVIANIIAFMGEVVLAISPLGKTKKQILALQIIDCTLNAIACLLVGSIAGVITNTACIVRNYLGVSGKDTQKNITMLCIITAVSSIISVVLVGQFTIIALLPTIATVRYTVYFYKAKEAQSVRKALAISLAIWFIHDIWFMLITSAVMDIIGIAVTVLSMNGESK